jgi:hypothetical protein
MVSGRAASLIKRLRRTTLASPPQHSRRPLLRSLLALALRGFAPGCVCAGLGCSLHSFHSGDHFPDALRAAPSAIWSAQNQGARSPSIPSVPFHPAQLCLAFRSPHFPARRSLRDGVKRTPKGKKILRSPVFVLPWRHSAPRCRSVRCAKDRTMQACYVAGRLWLAALPKTFTQLLTAPAHFRCAQISSAYSGMVSGIGCANQKPPLLA